MPGWLGLAVDDSLVPGRLVVVEVDPRGPAAKAGIRLQDMVLAIDGEPTLDAERFAAAVSAITAGDEPRLSIGRGGTVEDIKLVAAPAPKRPEPAATGRETSPREPETRVATADGAATNGTTIQEPSAFNRKPLPPVDVVTPTPPAGTSVGALVGPEPVKTAAVPLAASQAAVPLAASQAAVPLAASQAAVPPAALPAFPDSPAGQAVRQGSTERDIRPQSGETSRSKTALGVRTVPVDTAAQARFSLPEPSGALVVGLVEDFPASRAGLPTGSVIVAFDRQPVRSPMELTRLVNEAPIGRPVKLEYVLPGGASGAAEVSLVTVPTPASQGPLADDAALRDELVQLRASLQAIARRIEELERRTSVGR